MCEPHHPQSSVTLRPATLADVPLFVALERAADARAFVIPYTAEDHARHLADPRIIYLCILADADVAGFFILALDDDGVTVEFRRIVVASKGRGTGQQAIAVMERLCREPLGRSRIWLDVFEDNARARRVYDRAGYTPFGAGVHGGRTLVLLEKSLVPA